MRALRGRLRPAFLDGKPLAWRAEVEPDGGPIRVRATLRDAELDLDALPQGPLALLLGGLEPHGRLAVDVEGEIPRALSWAAMRPTGDLHIELQKGLIEHPTTGASLAIDSGVAKAQLAATGWGLESSAEGRFQGSHLTLSARAGPLRTQPDSEARVTVRVRELEISEQTLRATGAERMLRRIWDGVQPSGVADVGLDLNFPSSSPGQPEVLVEIVSRGGGGVAYAGIPHPVTGRQIGFPLPTQDVHGSVVVLVTPVEDGGIRDRVGLMDLTAKHPYGPDQAPLEAFANGIIVRRRAGAGVARPQSLMNIEVEGLATDEALREALTSLPGTGWIWPTLVPTGGRVDAHFGLQFLESFAKPVALLEATMEDTQFTWNTLPMPLQSEQLEFVLLLDSGLALGARSNATLRAADSVDVDVRLFGDPAQVRSGIPTQETLTAALDIDLQNVSLRGDDIEILKSALPGVGGGLDSAAAAGKFDAQIRLLSPRPEDMLSLALEATPRLVECVPAMFPVRTRAIEGRALIDARLSSLNPDSDDKTEQDDKRTVIRLAPIAGEWNAGARVAISGTIDTAGPSRQTVYAARVRTADRNLMAAVAGIASPGDASPKDLSVLELGGRIDCSGVIEFDLGGAPRTARTSFRAQLRGNELTLEKGPGLQKLTGPLEIGPDGFYCPAGTGVLGSTPIQLEDFLVESAEGGGYRLRARLRAEGLPLDQQHLSWMLDEQALTTLIDEFGWRGEVDLVDTELLLQSHPSGEFEVEFEGRLLFSDVFLLAGLPVRISSAFADVRSSVYKNGSVRAWAELSDLFGSIANRSLEDATLVATYLTPRLNVLELDGRLAGGAIRGLQTRSARTGPVLSLDLESPFRFELGIRLDDAQLSQILAGLYESTVESRGELDAQVRLFGNLENLVELRGSGEAKLQKARLWSIPVVRLILSTLGAEDSAVFDEVSARFQLEAGQIQIGDLRVFSPLMNLIGLGTLDLDGSLNFELQVRYSLIDKLGPLTRLLYWVQNNLISISVSGDMSRPQVKLRGLLGFLSKNKPASRDLPLPPYSPLPERF